jgi:hypothetical protein
MCNKTVIIRYISKSHDIGSFNTIGILDWSHLIINCVIMVTNKSQVSRQCGLKSFL